MPINDVITTNKLTLGYARHPVVKEMTINIHAGEFIGLFGPNGSGKSTFLRTLLGLINPISGNLSVLGQMPHRGHQHIGYMPQLRDHTNIAHLSSRSILEITLNGTDFGLPCLGNQQKKAVQQVLEKVGAASIADRSFQQLSGGERQRIYLAQALLDQPTILLLDEPLTGLDPRSQETFINLLCDIQKEMNVTILFSAHDPNPLLDVMTRVLYFAEQKAIIGCVNEVMTSPVLSALYGIPIEVIQLKERLFVLGEGHLHNQETSHHG